MIDVKPTLLNESDGIIYEYKKQSKNKAFKDVIEKCFDGFNERKRFGQ